MNKKVMIAMSGGVDSSVAAVILKQGDYDVIGVTLKLFGNEEIGICDKTKTCCSLTDVEDARNVSYKLGFPHYVFNFKDIFCKEVIDRFIDSYNNGFTPNPCIDCNRYIKFSELLKRAVALEYDYIATGHYAKTEFDSITNRYLLKKPLDSSKDQTYVLYSLTQDELSKTLFPLGDLEKSEVRKIADSSGLINANKPDSQDICFVPDGDYASFIEDYTGQRMCKGDFLDTSGNILGEHKGIIHYTIGQRKGLGKTFGRPMYVAAKDMCRNTVTLGSEDELYKKSLIANDINFISIESLTAPMKVKAKTRYRQKEESATIFPLENGEILVEFEKGQRAITPGQAVVFYDGDIVVGGGTIIK